MTKDFEAMLQDQGIKDSKLLSEKKREKFYEMLKDHAGIMWQCYLTCRPTETQMPQSILQSHTYPSTCYRPETNQADAQRNRTQIFYYPHPEPH